MSHRFLAESRPSGPEISKENSAFSMWNRQIFFSSDFRPVSTVNRLDLISHINTAFDFYDFSRFRAFYKFLKAAALSFFSIGSLIEQLISLLFKMYLLHRTQIEHIFYCWRHHFLKGRTEFSKRVALLVSLQYSLVRWFRRKFFQFWIFLAIIIFEGSLCFNSREILFCSVTLIRYFQIHPFIYQDSDMLSS